MKKYLILLLAAAAILASCGEEILDPEEGNETVQATPLTFNLTANHPDATKAIKSNWAIGDVIFVFFSGVEAPRYLKMTYYRTKWTCEEYNGATQTAGALNLKDGDTGTMRAVFLPFGNAETVSANGTDFVFSKTYYAYYLTATLSYTVTDNMVNGAFNMTIPDDYVQFFIEDTQKPTDGGYRLGTDAVIPVGVASIAADGTITETSDKQAGDDMPGYVYDNGIDPKGYLFSGKLNGNYHSYRKEGNQKVEANAYYFVKTKSSGNSRTDLFGQREKALGSHDAVKLPGHNSGRWVPVGADITVDMGSNYGTWYTCNYNASFPESIGTTYNYDDIEDLTTLNEYSKTKLPTKAQFDNLYGCSRAWLTVHGQQGMAIKSNQNQGLLFLPAQTDLQGSYWCESVRHSYDDKYDYYGLFFGHDGSYVTYIGNRQQKYTVRTLPK